MPSKVYVGLYDNNFYCLDATDGALVWSYTTGNIVLSSPIVANGVAYALSADKTVYAFGADPPLSGAAWSKTYGGTGEDTGQGETVQTSDGGYAMAGYITSFGGYKIYLIKADASGNMQWNQTYAPTTVEIGIHGIQTAEGGYAIVGWNYVNGQDFALHKMNATGDLEWTKSYGGTGIENKYALLQTDDGGYLLTGNKNSFGASGTDFWLFKVDGAGVIPESFTNTVVVLLSTVSVAVSFWLLRKKPKLKNSLLEKP